MSIINKVLRELDQRHAIAESPDGGAPREVRPVPDPIPGHEWFWRILAVLLLVALAWVGWVYYQIYPRRIVTDLGIAAGEQARQNAPRPAEATVAPPQPEAAPVATTVMAMTEPAGLRLAESIATPITEPAPPSQKPAAREPKTKAQGPTKIAPRVEKLELTPATVQRAEAEFRRGAALLQQGRVSEAESRFAVAIGLDPAHERARQTLAAMLIEQRRLEDARRLLQDGLRVNPRQQQFAIALARIYLERTDYPAALEVLNNGRNDAQPSAEYDAVLGSVLSRMGRDREAVEAYRAALRAAPDKGGTWLGLALALENLDRRAEAADAYRRALASGTLTADVRQYAEQKVRALR
jgi:MSHA biogenesis protein MshN